MATVRFTYAIQRHVECPPGEFDGATVRDALDRYFEAHPRARSYVVDDRGALRRHVVVFVDGRSVSDRQALTDPVAPDSLIDVMQALSGG